MGLVRARGRDAEHQSISNLHLPASHASLIYLPQNVDDTLLVIYVIHVHRFHSRPRSLRTLVRPEKMDGQVRSVQPRTSRYS